MKKALYFLIFLLIFNSQLIKGVRHDRPVYNINIDINALSLLSPSQWVNSFYLEVSDGKDKECLQSFFLKFSTQAKKALAQLKDLAQLLEENTEHFEAISEKILSTTKIGCDIEDPKTLAGSWAFCNIMRLFVMPDGSDKPLITREDFIDAIPEMMKFLITVSERSDECLKLMHALQLSHSL